MIYNKINAKIKKIACMAQLDRLKKMQRFTPGNIKILGWDLDYVDSYALWSCIDVLVYKRWNDFVTDNKDSVILDCGANIGVSVLNYKRHFPGAEIIAFEPDPVIVKVLKRNLTENSASNVKIIEAAVWTENGEMPFFCEGADGSRIVVDGQAELKYHAVKTIDLADFIIRPIDLIKMDIEGAEYDVISHLASRLELVKNMVIECHLYNEQINRFAELLHVLALAGFKVSVNSYGAWRDLIHKPEKLPNEFDQYILIAAWRE